MTSTAARRAAPWPMALADPDSVISARPAEIGGGMRRLGDVAHAGRQGARVSAPERDDGDRLPEYQQRTRKAVDVTTDTGCRRGERATVNSDPEHVGQRSADTHSGTASHL